MHPAVAGTRITRAEASSHLITSQTRCSNAQPASWHESDRHEPSSQLPGQHTAALQHCTGTTALHQCRVQQGHHQRSSSATVAADSHCGSAPVSSTPHSVCRGSSVFHHQSTTAVCQCRVRQCPASVAASHCSSAPGSSPPLINCQGSSVFHHQGTTSVCQCRVQQCPVSVASSQCRSAPDSSPLRFNRQLKDTAAVSPSPRTRCQGSDLLHHHSSAPDQGAAVPCQQSDMKVTATDLSEEPN